MSSTDNYTVGKGRIAFSQKASDGSYGPFLDMGNCPELTSSVEAEKLEHFSSRDSMKKKDKEIILSTTVKLSFTLDEITPENFNMQMLGTKTLVSQAAVPTGSATITSKKNAYFDLGKRNVTSATIASYTAGTDFILLGNAGYIYIPETSTIADDTELTVSFVAGTSTHYTIAPFKNTVLEGKMLFIGQNPVGADPFVLQFNSVQLTPSGDMGYISDEWLSMQFECEVMADSNGDYGTVITA